jgi:hypothetical protein
MKPLIGTAIMLTLILSVAPALAGDTFHALSRLPAMAQASLTPMDEAQLATIEGGQVCQRCGQIIRVTQLNRLIVRVIQLNFLFVIINGSSDARVNVLQQNSVDVSAILQNLADVRQVLRR